MFLQEGFQLPESELGDRVSLDEARDAFKFNVPTYLPRGTTLERVYVGGINGEVVSIYYDNRNLQSFVQSIKTSLVITIVQTDRDPIERMLVDLPPVRLRVEDEEGVRVVEVPRQRSGSLVTVCGVNAWANEPSDLGVGGLLWWMDGVEYQISGRMPVSQTMRIANSMC